MKSLLLWLRHVWIHARAWFTRPRLLRFARAEDMPNRIKKGFVYLIGDNNHTWCVALLCPCGCGATVQLNTLADVRPHWKVTQHLDKTISLHPSVWRQVGCRSHFFVKRGLIEWCGD